MHFNFQEQKNKTITFCKSHKNEIVICITLATSLSLLYLEKKDNCKKAKIISDQAFEIMDLKNKNSILTSKLIKLDQQNAKVSSDALRLHSSIGGKIMAERRYAPIL